MLGDSSVAYLLARKFSGANASRCSTPSLSVLSNVWTERRSAKAQSSYWTQWIETDLMFAVVIRRSHRQQGVFRQSICTSYLVSSGA